MPVRIISESLSEFRRNMQGKSEKVVSSARHPV
jgi:hypothetical protein